MFSDGRADGVSDAPLDSINFSRDEVQGCLHRRHFLLDLGLDLVFNHLRELAFQVVPKLYQGILSEARRLGLGLGVRNLLGDSWGLVVAEGEVGEIPSEIIHHAEVPAIRSRGRGIVVRGVILLLRVAEVGEGGSIRRKSGGCSTGSVATTRWVRIREDHVVRDAAWGSIESLKHTVDKILCLEDVSGIGLEENLSEICAAIGEFDAVDTGLGFDKFFDGLDGLCLVIIVHGDFVGERRGE